MSNPNTSRPPRREGDDDEEDALAMNRIAHNPAGHSNGVVSGFPFVPVYAPPIGHTYGQQQQLQFPPPLQPQNYVDYRTGGIVYKAGTAYPAAAFPPPPAAPSLYYSRYPVPGYMPNPQQPHHIVVQPQTPQGGNPQPAIGMAYNHGQVYTAQFSEQSTRTVFTSRVLSVILFQLILSTLFSGLCLEVRFLQQHVVKQTPWIVFIALLTAVGVILYWKLRTESARKRPMELYLFGIWTITWVVILSWITSLLDFQFLFTVQIFLTIVLTSLVKASACMGVPLFSGKSLAFTSIVTLTGAVVLAIVYLNDTAVIFFALFTSSLVLLYFLFRLHYLMGDELRSLQLNEVLTGAMSMFF